MSDTCCAITNEFKLLMHSRATNILTWYFQLFTFKNGQKDKNDHHFSSWVLHNTYIIRWQTNYLHKTELIVLVNCFLFWLHFKHYQTTIQRKESYLNQMKKKSGVICLDCICVFLFFPLLLLFYVPFSFIAANVCILYIFKLMFISTL